MRVMAEHKVICGLWGNIRFYTGCGGTQGYMGVIAKK